VTERFWRRPFQWGVLIISDPVAEADVPDIRENEIVATSTMILVPVHHAQDVDTKEIGPAEVEVRCFIDAGMDETAAPEFSGTVLCPSGRLTLGDADSVEAFDVFPGTVRIAVSREPMEHADVATIWINPRETRPAPNGNSQARA
jgi:hypothetical protein